MGELFSSLDKHTIDVTTPEEKLYELETGKTVQEYEASFANRGKQIWYIIQATLMLLWMWRGFRLYNQVQEGWSKVKTLFVI